MRSLKVFTLLTGSLSISACARETVLPDTQLRAPGSSRNDEGGFGLGSGGITMPIPSSEPAHSPMDATDDSMSVVERGGFLGGSGN